MIFGIWCAAAVALSISGAAPLVIVQADAGKPRLRVEAKSVSWKSKLQGDGFQHSFEVHNDGDAPLEIVRVAPNCGCLTIESYTEESIPPGGKGLVTISIDTSHLLGSEVRKTTSIETNDRKAGLVSLELFGEVRAILDVQPSDLAARVYPHQSPVIEAILRPATELGGEIRAVRVQDPKVKTTFEPFESGGGKLTIRGAASAKVMTVGHNLELDIRTVDGKLRKTTITARFEVRARWAILAPAMDGRLMRARFITFPKDEVQRWSENPEQPLEKTLTLVADDPGFTFKVTGTRLERAPTDLYEARVTPSADGREYQVTVRLLRVPAGRIARGRLFVVTDDPDVPEQRVDLRAFSVKK